ncbi:MAG: tyrosine-type recombinase/integrase [Phycisphaeraceae bacterium]
MQQRISETTKRRIAAMLGRGDAQEGIADAVGVSQNSVSTIRRELAKDDPAIGRGRRKSNGYWRDEDASTTPPPNLDTPAHRVQAYIASLASPHSRRAYAADLRHAADLLALGSTADLVTIDVAHGMRLLELLRSKGYAGSTVRRKLQVVSYLLAREVRLGFRTPPNPLDPIIVRRPKGEPRSTLDVLTPDEVRTVIEACDAGTHPNDIRDAALLRVAFWCGLRVGELAGMSAAEPSDWKRQREGAHFIMHGGERLLRVVGKGERLRTMPVGDDLVAAVERHLKHTGGDWRDACPLWRGARGRKAEALTTRSIRRQLKVRCARANIGKHISAHSTRKTAATRLLNLGVDLERVRLYLGHSSLETTQRYLVAIHDLSGHAARAMSY